MSGAILPFLPICLQGVHRDNLPLPLPHNCGVFFPERAASLQHTDHFLETGMTIFFFSFANACYPLKAYSGAHKHRVPTVCGSSV